MNKKKLLQLSLLFLKFLLIKQIYLRGHKMGFLGIWQIIFVYVYYHKEKYSMNWIKKVLTVDYNVLH